MASDYKTRTQTLIDDVVSASKLSAKKRGTDVRAQVAELASVAYNQGLLPDELLQLIDLIISRSYLDQASLNAIIKNLYPVEKVPEGVVLRIIGALGLGELKPSLTLQSSLLQWIIQAYHVFDGKAQAALSRAYAVLFNLLDVSVTRPQLFHILAIITRRKHVQHYRIQSLLNLTRQIPNDRHLQGLLRVYRNYYPEIIVGNTGKGATFKLPDPEWKDRLSVIQRTHRELQQSASSGPRDGFKTNQQLLIGGKGSKPTAVPGVQTSNAHEKSVTLEEIDSAESLASNLEKIELPEHLVAVLVDPLLQKFMMLRPDKDLKRASAWMDMQIYEMLSGDADEDVVTNTLKAIHEYARNTMDISPFLAGLVSLLQMRLQFNSSDSQIFDVLAYTPIINADGEDEPERVACRVSETNPSAELSVFISTLESSLDGSADTQLKLLDLYAKIVSHWGVILLSSDEIPDHASASLTSLIEHVNQLSLTLLQTAPGEHTLLKVLDFYERVAFIYSKAHLLRVITIAIPPVLLVYTAQFSTSLATVSRLCTVLTAYKDACQVCISNAGKKIGPAYDKQQVNTFNGFLMDICNSLWRGKAFAKSDAHSKGCMLPDGVATALAGYVSSLTDSGSAEIALITLFTLSYSPLLSLQAMEHMQRLEEQEDEDVELRARHAGPITQRSLGQLARKGGLELAWQEYRLGLLRHLEDKGWSGIPQLMYSAMKNLSDARSRS